jgi:hypothetical protein
VKPALALEELGRQVERVERAGRETLIVGANPMLVEEADCCGWAPVAGLLLQWLPDSSFFGRSLEADTAHWHRCSHPGCGLARIRHCSGSWRGYPCGHYDGDRWLGGMPRGELEFDWAAARNSTQWVGDA